MEPKLIILDADGTLIDRDTGKFLPGVERWLAAINHPGCRNRPALAIATNQGGPACHDAGWDFSDQFPALAEVRRRYESLAAKIEARLYLSLVYRTKDGALLRPISISADDPAACEDWRKPNPGMLLAAMAEAGVEPSDTLMIGDRPEDQKAAEAAGCYFQWAQKFFGCGWEKGKNYGLLG